MANNSKFAPPEPLWVSIDSRRPPSEVAAALDEATSRRRYSVPHGEAQGFLRLGGTVSASRVELKAKPYLVPGIWAGQGSLTLYFSGRIEETPDGSLLTGLVSAPIPRSVPLVLGGWVGFLGVVGAIIGAFIGSPVGLAIAILWVLALAVLVLLITPIWTLTLRYNQRAMLRRAHEFEDFLRSIVDAAGGGSTQS